jgi:DNA-binding CsgD family transcriptional regulator
LDRQTTATDRIDDSGANVGLSDIYEPQPDLLCAALQRAEAKPMIKKPRRVVPEPKSSPRSAKPRAGSKPPSIQSNPPSPRDILTPRERAVMRQIARGATSREAGADLGVSTRTIEFHRANIMRKLNVRRIVDLMLLGLKNEDI